MFCTAEESGNPSTAPDSPCPRGPELYGPLNDGRDSSSPRLVIDETDENPQHHDAERQNIATNSNTHFLSSRSLQSFDWAGLPLSFVAVVVRKTILRTVNQNAGFVNNAIASPFGRTERGCLRRPNTTPAPPNSGRMRIK